MAPPITSKPFADKKVFVLLPKAMKKPNIAKSLFNTCNNSALRFSTSIFILFYFIFAHIDYFIILVENKKWNWNHTGTEDWE